MGKPSIPQSYTFTLKDFDFFDVRATVQGGGQPISTQLTGDPGKPISTQLTGDPNKPISTQLTGDPGKPISTQLTGDPNKPISTQLTGDPNKPIAATVELLNIPRLSLTDIKDLLTPKLRIQMPNYQQLCFKLFGVEIFSLCLSGEMQTITQGYEPNAFERCEIDCPELDTRPFPRETGTHNKGTPP